MDTIHRRRFLISLGTAAIAGGCTTVRSAPKEGATRKDQIRVNCYGLLYQLLGQQKNVDKLLWFKVESRNLDDLITAIADASEDGADRLQNFSEADPELPLDQIQLPPGERATRDAIADTKKKELLKPFNPDFEIELLLTQSEALSYAWHLALVAAENESNDDRADYLRTFAARMKTLHSRAMTLLWSSIRSSKHDKPNNSEDNG